MRENKYRFTVPSWKKRNADEKRTLNDTIAINERNHVPILKSLKTRVVDFSTLNF